MKRSEFDKEITTIISMARSVGNDDLRKRADALQNAVFSAYWSYEDINEFHLQLLQQLKNELLGHPNTTVVIEKTIVRDPEPESVVAAAAYGVAAAIDIARRIFRSY